MGQTGYGDAIAEEGVTGRFSNYRIRNKLFKDYRLSCFRKARIT